MPEYSTQRLWASEAAKYLRMSRSTLSKWRMRGYGPRWFHFGPRRVCYLKADLDAWLAECALGSSDVNPDGF
jgi:excisionase family DNA binding protein